MSPSRIPKAERITVTARDGLRIEGTLWDRVGPAISFGDDAFRLYTRMLIDFGMLADDYDGSWRRDETGG